MRSKGNIGYRICVCVYTMHIRKWKAFGCCCNQRVYGGITSPMMFYSIDEKISSCLTLFIYVFCCCCRRCCCILLLYFILFSFFLFHLACFSISITVEMAMWWLKMFLTTISATVRRQKKKENAVSSKQTNKQTSVGKIEWNRFYIGLAFH